MLTSNAAADPSCSTTKSSLVETADHVEAEESGWTDCFTWEKLLYTGKDLEDLATSSQISTARVSTLTHSETCNYELVAADLICAKEARQCLIADHTTSGGANSLKRRQARQLQAGVCSGKLTDGFAAQNHAYVGASSLVSDASSGPSSSFNPFMSSPFLKTKTGMHHDAALLNKAEMDRVAGGRFGSYKRVCGTFQDSSIAVENTSRKMKRRTTILPSNSHSSSSLMSAALPSAAALSSQLHE